MKDIPPTLWPSRGRPTREHLAGRFLGKEFELRVIDDSINPGIIRKEGNNLHFSLAFKAKERVNLIGNMTK
jgi:hypothetical protein